MNHRIRRIDLATGVVSTIAGTGQAGFSGDGGPATQAQLNQPYRMLIDKAGDLLFSDKSNHRVRRISRATGVITTVAGDGQRGGEPTRSIAEAGGLAMTADGSVYVADEAWCFIRRLIPGSTTMEVVAGCDGRVFSNVNGMTVDRSGGLLLADSANGRIRRLDPATKTIATLVGDVAASFGGDGGPAAAAGLNRPNGLAQDRAGNIYLSDQRNGAIRRIDAQTGRISTIWRGGCPGAITIDRQHQLYAADSCENDRVIKLNLASGESSIISGFKSAGTGIAVDSVGNIYVSESNQHKVLRVDAQSGAISTFAGNGKDLNDGDGGPATAASLRWPFGLWVDTNDNLYIAARNNQVIRRVDARTGLIATVAGSDRYGYSGDGGSSTAAAMRNPHGIAMDTAGNLLIVDSVSNVVRFVEAESGRISTTAGSGLRGFAGDYGPAVQARLDEPENVLVDRTGNVLITDMANNRVRIVHCAAQPQPGFVRDCVAGASPLYAGQRVWVSWNVLGASSCTANGAWSGPKSAVGGEWVFVKATGAQDFKLDCTGPGGSTSGISARAEVVTNPLRVTLSASSLTVKFGEKVRLSWSAVNATSCVARGTWSGNKALSGQEESVALDSQAANEFVLTCTGATGSVSETVTVNVVDQSPSLNISASAVSVRRGETVRLDWTSQRATRCVASGGWGGSRAVSGSFTTSPLTAASTSFALVCQGATGTVRDEVTVVTTDATAGNAGPQISLAVRRPVTGTISTVAGQGPVAYEVETAPALEMMLNGPHGLARDAGGNLYIAEAGNHVVRRVSAATGEIAIVAGRGIPGGDGDGGLATEARLSYPTNLAFDSVGNLYIADQGNNRIRVVDRVSGVIRTVAGNGSSNFSGDGGLATLAALRSPTDVAFDATGNLYITDWGNARIRRVDVATRLISTFAGTGNAASSGDGGNALQADINPYGLAIDGRGDLVFTEINQHRVRRIDQSTRTVRTIAGTGTAGFSGDGGPAISAALSTPHGISIDTAGNVFVGDASNYRIRRIDPAGTISTFAGGGNAEENGTSATDVRLTGRPIDVVMGDSGLWYTEFESGRVRKIDSSTLVVTTVAGGARPGFGGDGGPAISASLNAPNRVARDSKGNLYIGDIDNQRIRRIDGRTGVVSTVISSVLPGLPLTPGGIAFDAADNLYFSEQRSNRVWRIGASDGVVVSVAGTGSRGYGGDGGLATSAILNEPGALRFDADGNLLIAEPGNLRVRKVTMATGIITTIAGTGECCGDADDGQLANASRLAYPSGIAVDRNRNVYIADRSNRVRKVDVAGVITTIAGNRNGGYSGENVLASNASLQIPSSVAVDSQGNVFFTEEEGYRVRKVERATGRLTTIAGNGERGFGGDGGSATSARFDNFRSDELIVDPSGNLLITDTRNNRVRVVHCAAAAESGITSDCASTAALAAGDRVQVSWSVTGATQCVASGAWRGEKRVSGGEWLWLGAGNRRYTLTCTGPGGVTVKDIDVTVALSAATDSGIAAVVPPTAPSRTGLARSSTLEISLTGIAQNGSRAPVVSETEVSTDVATQGGGGRYVIVGESNASADQRRWLLQRRETGDGVSAERELPKTQDVLWRRKSGAGVPLPSTAWVRQCGATVYTVQDGYRLQLTAWDAELANGWQSEITLGETGRSTLLTEVACAGDALRVTGHSLGINEFEPSLDSVMDDARRFSAILVRGRSEPTEADWGDSPFSVAAFCASSSRERAMFCARYRDVPAN
jgi:sugar lactone lactonase YvrE